MESSFRLLTSMLQITFHLNFLKAYSEGNIQDNYIGCYFDAPQYQHGRQKITLQSNTALTIEWCIRQCLMRNATYAGLENSKACLCRNNLDVMLPDVSCNSLCPGNQSEYCGGSNGHRAFYSLYTVCKTGYYGYMCNLVCHCRRQAPCDRMTGKCPNECEGKWFGRTCSDIHLSEKYIGCFRDNNTRAFSSEPFSNAAMTIEFCTSMCILRNNSIAGLQAGSHCSCGETYTKYGPLGQHNCKDPCKGNRSQNCGGGWANSVYSVCPAGYYGPNCHKQCHCYNNSRCVYLTGECNSTCKAGWTGSSCNIRDCMMKSGDCFQNETCATINLDFATITGCRCSPGYDRKAFWDTCEDIDEWLSGYSMCSPTSENCINNIGSYRCECNDGYRNESRYCVAFSSMVAIGILLGTLFLFAISLLINAFLVFDRMKSPKQTKPETMKEATLSDLKPRSVKLSDTRDKNCDGIPESFDSNNVYTYEEISLEQLQIHKNSTSVYLELK